MLRKIRITLAILCFIAITLLFLDFTGTLHSWLGWLAQIQFLPAVLALNVAVVAGLLILTLVAGRLYCSVICPLGVMQDVISWFSSRRKKKKARFTFRRANNILRVSVAALFVVAMLAGAASLASVIAPYSAYGRIATNLFAPVYQWGNNVLAYFSQRLDSYAFYDVEVWLRSVPSLVVAIVTLLVLTVVAWHHGRLYCNTVCPVGTILGFVSRYAMFRPVIDRSKCVGCSLCSRKCKSSCIDYKNHNIDYSRCVACMDCLDSCSKGAVSLKYSWKKPQNSGNEASDKADASRRTFLSMAAITGSWLVADARRRHRHKVDGGLAVIQDKKLPSRSTPIVPAGAVGLKHLTDHCTACQLCISACPNQVLRPSGDMKMFMQPVMGYERGYCRPECTRCAEVCPTDAIKPVSREEKSSIQIGRAVWVKENCVVITDGVSCGNCARHCPSGAIMMVAMNADNPDSPKIPVVNTDRCIGCGACENLCPVQPFSAIYVEGNQVHHII